MISQWWSITLTAVGLVGLVLTMRKHLAGPFIGAGIQVLWIAYALVSHQPAFIASALAYGAVNVYGIQRWMREREPPHPPVDEPA
ncbi:nicotinamide mononucleotide transporter [Rhodococcus sp. JVH1]|uniref:nicotinamide mononucleotide transporter n=1 Tax=Rhodococcus sp. JVH1 TaxID=745408 RepID=UPI0005C1C081|nr:nicotinamide mononucleotide transporter [Rhodococcus sp. JVH1]